MGRIYKDIGFGGLWNGLVIRIFMIGTLTSLRKYIRCAFKCWGADANFRMGYLRQLQDFHGSPKHRRCCSSTKADCQCLGPFPLGSNEKNGDGIGGLVSRNSRDFVRSQKMTSIYTLTEEGSMRPLSDSEASLLVGRTFPLFCVCFMRARTDEYKQFWRQSIAINSLSSQTPLSNTYVTNVAINSPLPRENQ